MHLPSYFLIDLPLEARLNAGLIEEACQTLKRNRELYLRDRPTASLIRTLSDLAAEWLQPSYSFRQLALQAGPEVTGFAPATLATGLDSFFRQLTPENLQALLVQDLGHHRRLDGLCATGPEQQQQRAALARGPEFLVHVAAGNIPNPIIGSIVFGLLLRSAQFVKCASGAAYLPRLFAHSLYEVEPKLGACLELAEWPGGNMDLESVLFREADCITATGTDETLSAIKAHVPARARFVGYGHRVSFGYITREALGFDHAGLIARATADVVAWNQRGCLSPHLFYVERSGRISPEDFAGLLATQLALREEDQPRGPVPPADAAAIASRRSLYEVRAAHLPETRQWASLESTAWTVVYEGDPRFQFSCANRFVYIKPVAGLTEALEAADPVRGRVSTVGLAATEERLQQIANALGRWGATRICPIGQMQHPPLTWRHDGRPGLGDLVTWTDWERPE